MAEITAHIPTLRHLRAEPTTHVLDYKAGRLRREGPGLAFWFRAINTAVAEVPIDDRELPFLFRARSADFQELAVQGAITFRVTDPRLLAERVDFTIDLDTGTWKQTPIEHVAGLLTQLAQQFVIDDFVKVPVREILTDGVAPIRDRITAGLEAEPALGNLGLEIVAVRVAAVSPTAEVEKALRQPTREAIQQEADEATFTRRALAVEKERAIAENELRNQIELARQGEELVEREGANDRRRAEMEAAALFVTAEAEDARKALDATREAESLETIGRARLTDERARAQIQAELGPELLLALAVQEIAGQLGAIEHLTVTPDLLAPLLQRLGTQEPRA